MLNVVLFIVALLILALLFGLIFQKELFTKILFLNSLTNLAILLITVLGSYKYNESYLDIAIIYAALSFIVSQAILKFIILRIKSN